MKQFIRFPTPDDTKIILQHDTGPIFIGSPQMVEGRMAQVIDLPDDLPNGNGAWLHFEHPDYSLPPQHGVLWLDKFNPVTGSVMFDADVVTLVMKASTLFSPAAREYRGNMCGVRVPTVSPVPGGARDASLVLSWFYDRYSPSDQAAIREVWQAKGLTDVLLSWPDSRVMGFSPRQFGDTVRDLRLKGFTPCVMLLSKDFDKGIGIEGLKSRIAEVLPFLIKNASRPCIGWELSLWLSPAQVQQLIDWLAPQVVPWGGKLYVHFQQGYASFDYNGPNATFAGFWNRNVGKLTGVLHQRDLTWDRDLYQAKLVDVLERFAGNYLCTPDSGFGHPFDCIALEITATNQFQEEMSEEEGNSWGRTALRTPPVLGPFGLVSIMGSGNGQ